MTEVLKVLLLVDSACNGFECVEVNRDGHTRVQNVIIPMKTLLMGICSMGGKGESAQMFHIESNFGEFDSYISFF